MLEGAVVRTHGSAAAVFQIQIGKRGFEPVVKRHCRAMVFRDDVGERRPADRRVEVVFDIAHAHIVERFDPFKEICTHVGIGKIKEIPLAAAHSFAVFANEVFVGERERFGVFAAKFQFRPHARDESQLLNFFQNAAQAEFREAVGTLLPVAQPAVKAVGWRIPAAVDTVSLRAQRRRFFCQRKNFIFGHVAPKAFM